MTHIEVFQRAGLTVARDRIELTETASGKNAAEVIQSAVNALPADGGKILVYPGSYGLDAPLRLRRNVVLQGDGRGTRLRVTPSNTEGIGIIVEGVNGAQVRDLAVLGNANPTSVAGIVLEGAGDCQLIDVFCAGFAQYGIWVRNQSFLCEVRGAKLAGNGQVGLYFDQLARGGRGGDFLPNIATSCIIYGGGKGIECHNAIVLNLVGCMIFQPGDVAFHIHTEANSILITGCRTFQCETHAILVEDAHELNVTGNIFCWHRGHGIVLDKVSWAAINGNEIIDTGVRVKQPPYATGIILRNGTQGVQITGNTIFNWGDQLPMRCAIDELADCQNNLIMANNINFLTETAIASAGVGTLVRDNVILDTPAYKGTQANPYADFTRDPILSVIDEMLKEAD